MSQYPENAWLKIWQKQILSYLLGKQYPEAQLPGSALPQFAGADGFLGQKRVIPPSARKFWVSLSDNVFNVEAKLQFSIESTPKVLRKINDFERK
jgi:hypothetical protein